MNRVAAISLLVLFIIAAYAEEPSPTYEANEPSVIRPIVIGTFTGIIGFACGYGLGTALGGDDWGAMPIGLGALVSGESMGLAAGVHYGNNSRGSLALDCLTSFGLLCAVALLNTKINQNNKNDSFLLTIPVFQLTGTVTVERHTGRNKRQLSRDQ